MNGNTLIIVRNTMGIDIIELRIQISSRLGCSPILVCFAIMYIYGKSEFGDHLGGLLILKVW